MMKVSFRKWGEAMRRFTIVLIAGLLACLPLSGCGKKKGPDSKKVYPVEAVKIVKQSKMTELHYVGVVDSVRVKRYSFKSGGKIQSVNIKNGEKVSKGQVLVSLDAKDLQIALAASQAQKNLACVQYEKAKRGPRSEEMDILKLNVAKTEIAYKNSRDNFERIKSLYESDAVSKSEYESAKMDMDVKKADYEQAQKQELMGEKGSREEDIIALYEEFKKAEADCLLNERLLKDAAIVSDVDGYVVDVPVKEGELVGQGSPVVAVREEKTVVKAGVSQDDVIRLKTGNEAGVVIDGVSFKGTITGISGMPGSDSMTYEVQIELDKDRTGQEPRIGSIASVVFMLGYEEGMWAPVGVILNDGEDYVFVIEDGRSVRKTITIEQIRGSEAKIAGIDAKATLIVKGMKNLREGYRVSADSSVR
jgi:HlyD family secretion protein